VPGEVNIPTFSKAGLAPTSDDKMYLPMTPVAPKRRTLEGTGDAMTSKRFSEV